jgi:hypothetical protein
MQIDSSPANQPSIQTPQDPGPPQSNVANTLSTRPAESCQTRQAPDGKNRRRLFPTASPDSSSAGTSTVNQGREEEGIRDFTPRGMDDSTPNQTEQVDTHRQSRSRKGKQVQAQAKSTKTAPRPTPKLDAVKTRIDVSSTTPGPDHKTKQAQTIAQPQAQSPRISNPEQDPTHHPTPLQASSSGVRLPNPAPQSTSTAKQANINNNNNTNHPAPSTARAVRSSERVSRARSIIDLCATF